MIGVVIMIVAVAIQSAAHNLGMFIGARWVLLTSIDRQYSASEALFLTQFPYRFRFDLRGQCGTDVGHRALVPRLPCASYVPLQLPLVLR